MEERHQGLTVKEKVGDSARMSARRGGMRERGQVGESIGSSHCVLCTRQEDMLYCEGNITGGTEGRVRVCHEVRVCDGCGQFVSVLGLSPSVCFYGRG